MVASWLRIVVGAALYVEKFMTVDKNCCLKCGCCDHAHTPAAAAAPKHGAKPNVDCCMMLHHTRFPLCADAAAFICLTGAQSCLMCCSLSFYLSMRLQRGTFKLAMEFTYAVLQCSILSVMMYCAPPPALCRMQRGGQLSWLHAGQC